MKISRQCSRKPPIALRASKQCARLRPRLKALFDQWQESKMLIPQSNREIVDALLERDRQFLESPKPLDRRFRRWTAADTAAVSNEYNFLSEESQGELGAAVGWLSTNCQFQAHCSLGLMGPDRHSILDLGAGFGYSLGFLEKFDRAPTRYVGVDAVELSIKLANIIHGNSTTPSQFILGDCLIDAPSWLEEFQHGTFDYVLATGLFGMRPNHWTDPEFFDLALRTVGRFLPYARKGLLFTVSPKTRHVVPLNEEMDHPFATPVSFDRMQLAASLMLEGYQIQGCNLSDFDLLVQTPFLVTKS